MSHVQSLSFSSPAFERFADLTIGSVKETASKEKRVAITPTTAQKYLKFGLKSVLIESGAGIGSGFDDASYSAVGCEVVESPKDVLSRSDIVVKVQPFSEHEQVETIQENTTVVSMINSNQDENKTLMNRIVDTCILFAWLAVDSTYQSCPIF